MTARTRRSSTGLLLALVAVVACQKQRRSDATASADTVPSAAPPAVVPVAVPSAAQAAPSLSASAAVGLATALPVYPPSPLLLTEPCADPRVVLLVRKQYDRSGRIWVQQALLAHPEFLLVKDKAARAGEIDVYETIYGPKNFAPTYPGEPLFNEAVVARCADVETCNRLAAMFHAVAPRERVEPVCGVPPATTGGFGRVAELAADRLLDPPAGGATALASCARLHACAARERVSLPKELDCARPLRPEWTACAASPSCSGVARCLNGKVP